MAYTDQNIIDAYNQAMAGGKSEAEFVQYAQGLGVSNDQLASAKNQLIGAASTPAPAPAAAPVASADRFTADQYNLARQWSSGKTADEIFGKAAEMGLTSDELGKVFGEFGGSGSQVTNLTGYASGYNGSLDKPMVSYMGGKLSDGSMLGDWSFDTTNGWSKTVKKQGSGNQWNSAAPSTGINLSQVQGTTPWTVDPNQTVQSQLQGIIAADSPLMQQAQARALQAANERGLLNSSMAVTAGQSALYDAAMPIAQQDAGTYADSARFNADASNAFSRDNNAFVRDAFMADFNVAANEWAAGQAFDRDVAKLNLQQRQTLERDAIQQGYTSARDKYLNEYTIARDNNQNAFTAGENVLDRQSAAERTAMGIQPDTSVQRTAMQIAAERDSTAIALVNDANLNIAKFKSDYASKVANLTADPNISPDKAAAAVENLTATYRPIVESIAISAGLDPTIASSGMTYTPLASAGATATTGTTGINPPP